MTEQNAKSWINTREGAKFFPLAARAVDVRIGDIAFALSNLCRYAGHVEFYSVAEHSLIVSLIVEALGGTLEEQRAGLLHDGTEAYLVDLPRPVKHAPELAAYRKAEADLGAVIAQRFKLATIEPDIVRDVDRQMITLEAERLVLNRHPDWRMPVEPHAAARRVFDEHVRSWWDPPMEPRFARREFLARFDKLFSGALEHGDMVPG